MLLTSPLLAQVPRVRHGFTTRQGGVSEGPYASWNFGPRDENPAAVEENRRRFLDALGVGGPVLQVSQVHGARVVDAGLVAPAVEADGILSTRPGTVVGIRTADCAPILLAGVDEDGTPHVAAVHAGWRGAVANIPGVAVAALADRGASPDRLVAAVGPTIGLDNFEVGPEVVEAARMALDGEEPRTIVNARGRQHLDLVDLIRRLLTRAGIADDHIDVVGGCTVADPELYFSHRRDQGVTGRHLAAIAVTDEASP